MVSEAMRPWQTMMASHWRSSSSSRQPAALFSMESP